MLVRWMLKHKIILQEVLFMLNIYQKIIPQQRYSTSEKVLFGPVLLYSLANMHLSGSSDIFIQTKDCKTIFILLPVMPKKTAIPPLPKKSPLHLYFGENNNNFVESSTKITLVTVY